MAAKNVAGTHLTFDLVVRAATFPPRSHSPPHPLNPHGPDGFHGKVSVSANSLALTASSVGTGSASRPVSFQESTAESTTSVGLPLSPVSTNFPDSHGIDSSPNGERAFLSLMISKAMVNCVGPLDPDDRNRKVPEDGETFFPEDQINTVICEKNIRRDREFRTLPDEVISMIVPRWRKLFAILTLVGKGMAIQRLIRDGIDDNCLPFAKSGVPGENHVLLYSTRNSTEVVRSLNVGEDGWSLSDVESFYARCQWQVVVPHLGVDCPCDGYLNSKVDEHHVFRPYERLPFIRVSDPKEGDSDAAKYFGPARSRHAVGKAYIHPAHRRPCRHAHPETAACCWKTPFAVKLIDKRGHEATARAEMEILRRFDSTPGLKHRHRIIRLLGSFEHGNTFYLLFPYATANLEQFWKDKFPHVSDLPRGPSLACWIAGEILGLVRGLHLIHNATPGCQGNKRLGRHGDIKPENILWFQDDMDSDLPPCLDSGRAAPGAPGGMLKFCDFGVTEYRSPVSVSDVPAKGVSVTTAYSAPEIESGGVISQRYDSWSLGCVLLHFVTWYAQGYPEGVEAFANKLSRPLPEFYLKGVPCVIDGKFFVREGNTVKVKPAVKSQIAMLRAHPDCCSPLFLEVLDVIEKRLLRCRKEERARSEELVAVFERIYSKCCRPAENGEYLTPRPGCVVDSTVSILEEEQVVTVPREEMSGADEELDIGHPSELGLGPDTGTKKGRRSWGWHLWGFLRARMSWLSCF